MIYNLSNLVSISDSLEKPKVERSIKADTKKNKIALFAACENKNLESLQNLIQLGMDVNIINERDNDPYSLTPLICCARQGWLEGLIALKEAGACEKKIPFFFEDDKGKPYGPVENKVNCLQVASIFKQPQAFSFLFELHDEKDRIKSANHVTTPDIFLVINKIGYSQFVSDTMLMNFIYDCRNGLNPLDLSPSNLLKRECIDRCFELLDVKNKPDLMNKIWLDFLDSYTKPGVIQGLALRGLNPPSEDGTLSMIPSKELYERRAPLFLTQKKKNPKSWSLEKIIKFFTKEADHPIRVGLATAAACKAVRNHHSEILYALCAIPTLRQELLNIPLGLYYLTNESYLNIKLLKRLADVGSDMRLIMNDEGQNPLHVCFKNRESKTNIEQVARVCLDWIFQKDSHGNMPIDYEDDPKRKVSLASLLDEMGLKDVLRHRRGHRLTQEKKRRL